MDEQQLSLIEEEGTPRMTTDTALKATIGLFKKHMEYEGFSPHTIQAFTSDLRLLSKYLGIGQPIGGVTTRNLDEFLKWMLTERGVPCSPKTYSRRVTTLKVFFRWLHKGGILEQTPAAPIIQRSVRSPLPVVLTAADVDSLLEAAEGVRRPDEGKKGDARPLLLLSLLLQASIKKGEVMDIVSNHIDRSDPLNPTLFIRYRNPAKRYKERKIQLDPDLLPILDEYLEQYDPPDTLFTCTARNLEYVLRDLERRAEVGKPVSFECMRWTSAVHSYLDGVDTDALRQKMGLSEITWRETLSKIQRLAGALKDGAAELSSGE